MHQDIVSNEPGGSMDNEVLESNYEDLFDDKSKIEAFDKIARNYYFCNFGSMQKSDFDTLMFSVFIERILDKQEENPNAYSDYTLSKILGITQQRINNLKIKKELKYPYNKFDWKKSFARLVKNARFENGKIKIYIPDPNLFLEIRNAIESEGGYIDVSLNSKLLQLEPEYYLWILRLIAPDDEKERYDAAITNQMEQNNFNLSDFSPASFSKIMREKGVDVCINIMKDCIPVVGPVIGHLLELGIKLMENNHI